MSSKTTSYSPRWKPYIGKEIQVILESETLFGVLNHPNLKMGYADFLPFWTVEADGEHIRIEREIPLRVSLSILEDSPAIIRPYVSGYMEQRLKIVNESLNRKKGLMGFTAEDKPTDDE